MRLPYKDPVSRSDTERIRSKKARKPAAKQAPQAGSDLKRPVPRNGSVTLPEFRGESRNAAFAGSPLALFSTPIDERQRRAYPVLIKVRAEVRHGVGLLDALLAVDGDLLHREFARHELISVVPFGLTLAGMAKEQDLSLLLLERAVARCTPVHVVRGGWSVTRRKSA